MRFRSAEMTSEAGLEQLGTKKGRFKTVPRVLWGYLEFEVQTKCATIVRCDTTEGCRAEHARAAQ
jgi:hypothetical protein